MQNILVNVPKAENQGHVWVLLLLLVVFVGLGLFVFGVFLATGYLLISLGFDFDLLTKTLSNPTAYPEARTSYLIVQGLSSVGAFIVASALFIKLNLRHTLKAFFPGVSFKSLGLTVVITFSFMVVNTLFIEWNQGWEFPAFLAGFEDWAIMQEEKLAGLTEYLTTFDSFGQFLVAFVVVAALPGIGEELLFRGLIQNLFHKVLPSPHLAIWLTAFLFAAFHMQFFGLVPRMFLGALFGYLYFYSGNLSLAMIGHFLNNGISLTMLYAYNQGAIETNPADTDAVPSWPVLLLFLVVFVLSFITFRKQWSDG